ncbi:MICOS complex subunit MIC27-like [Oppia nitens]|uniref:MICOS complex subunit MIC27-like n=1 Tax=Oppia nitens TaxID=1686743 RepID=UPI0023D9A64F|nr:MICOS complex subunit MIC27-like [Oppia nitens]
MTETLETTSATKPCCQSKAKKLMKISELPLYGNPYPRAERVIIDEELGYIESGVQQVRQQLNPVVDTITKSSERAVDILKTSYYHSLSTYEYISAEGNTVAKAAAITTGGLLGLLISSRRGFFKKVFYTTAGLTAASAACYPKEAKELSQIGLFIVKTKGPEIVKEYTGVDLSQKTMTTTAAISSSPTKSESKKSIDYVGQEDNKNKSQSSPQSANTGEKGSPVKGDYGMARKEDQDLYANRSTK